MNGATGPSPWVRLNFLPGEDELLDTMTPEGCDLFIDTRSMQGPFRAQLRRNGEALTDFVYAKTPYDAGLQALAQHERRT